MTVRAYDALGRRVAELFSGPAQDGIDYPLAFDGGELPAGIYVVRLEGASFSATRRVTLIR